MKRYLFLITSFLTALVASGATWYVVPGGAGSKNGTSWANAYSDVQTAINKASSAGGGEVWIAKGTYKHGSAMTMKNNVAIYGGFAGTETSRDQRVAGNNTILDGENSYRVFYNNYTESNPLTNSAKLDNVTIQNGYISGSGAGMCNYYASPEITNCTFANNSAENGGGGMENFGSSPDLTNCTFSDNSANYGGGMENYSSSPVLTNCTFSNNSASERGGGMINSWYSSPVLTNCILWGNTASSSVGEIYNGSNCKPTIYTCIIKGGVEGIYDNEYGIYTNIITADPKLMPLGNYGGNVQTCPVVAGSSAIGAGKVVAGVTTDARGVARSSTPTIGACEFANKLSSVSITTSEGYLKYSSSYEFTLNANVPDANNLTYQWYKDGVAISGATSSSYKTSQSVGTSKYTVEVSDGTTSITSSEIAIETTDVPRYYVSTTGNSSNDGLSWATAKSDLQEAIDLASSHNVCGVEVWIAKGTYKHGSAMTMKNNVHIYGGFAGTETSKDQRVAGQNKTYLDGEGKYSVFYNNYTEENQLTTSAKLDNVTIQNGYSSSYGGGMYNDYASPEITNSTFSGNSASSYGGGMYNSSSSPVFTNCTFTNNSATDDYSYGGGMYNSSSSPVLTNCTFSNNSAYSGGGMYNDYSSPVLTNSTFSGNSASRSSYGYGGGMCNDYSSPVLTNCTFTNNSAYWYGGGMHNSSSSPELTNCTFSGNSASDNGGGMDNSYSSPTLTNCTFSGNSASCGGGMYNGSSSPVLTNCTFSGNSASRSSYGYGGGMYNDYSSPVLTNCILWGNTASSGGNEIYNYDSNNKPTIDTCIIKGGYSSYGAYTNIITADPKLMPLGNYGGSVQTCPVGAGSSAIETGQVVEGVTTDARGFPRSTSTPTIGACEYTFKDYDTSNPPSIKTTEGYLKYGSSYEFTLNIFITGNNLTYQWYKDGEKIEGATSSSYKTSQRTGTSKYTVEVSDGNSTITSSEIAIESVDTPRCYVSTTGSSSNDGLSWATAKSDVQEVIDLASAHNVCGVEVWIAKGTYKHGSAMTMKNGVAIYGGFAGTETSKDQRVSGNHTILDGEGKYSVFDNYCTSSNPLTNSAKLDNVTIQNGYTGMCNVYASPEITNCTFSGNSASSRGGGMGNYNSSSPVLTNCTFTNNSASSYGGGMSNYNSSSPELTNCTFSGNSASSRGGGMHNDYYSSPVLTNCTFTNNSASGSSNGYGGGMFNDGYYGTCSPVLTNCTFTNNSASSGGGMYNSRGSPKLTNCTFSNNSARYGGGMYNYSPTSPKLTNCILWGNAATSSGNEIYNDDSNNRPTIDTCIIKGGYSSSGTYTNIITADPKLMPLGNYGGSVQTMPVASGSSAIGKGKVMEGLTTDARGFARSSTPTIGACEFANQLTWVSITTAEGYYKYSSSYEFTLNANVPEIDLNKVNLTYQWYKNGTAIKGATSSSYKTSQSAGTSKYYVVVSDGTTTITSSKIAIETVNVSCYYVSTEGSSENDGLSWATAKSDLQDAIDLAHDNISSEYYGGTEVWIAKGTYKHGSAMTMKNNVAIYGGFAGTEMSKEERKSGNNTILDGENSYRVFWNNYSYSKPLTNSAKLDNVTIQNGYTNSDGAGMYNYYASPTLTNCTFIYNKALVDGGAIMCYASSNPTIINCTFYKNSAGDEGGAFCNEDSSPKLTNCTITSNTAERRGGAICNDDSNPTITNCILWGNASESYEIYNYGANSRPIIDTCIIKQGKNAIYNKESAVCTYLGSLITTDPLIQDLVNNGGNVQTIAVAEGSSASEAGKVVEGVTTDARGVERSKTAPTIGAYEYAEPPTITVQPIAIEIYHGATDEISVSATGGNLAYQWYFNGEAIEGATSSTLSFENTQMSASGEYYCIISNQLGSIKTSIADVIVQQSADDSSIITALPENVYAIANTGFIRFVVETTAYNPTFKWFYGSNEIEGETSNVLFIPAESQYNRTNIKCEISNAGGTTSTSARLVYTSNAVVITSQPQDVSCKIGETATFAISATTRTNVAYYQWQHSIDGEQWNDIEGATNNTYSVEVPNYTKAGYYRCEVDNGGGILYSEKAKLSITTAVEIISQPQDTNVVEGQTATFEVGVKFAEGVSYCWEIYSDGIWTMFENVTSNTNKLVIENVNSTQHLTQYRCKITAPDAETVYTNPVTLNTLCISQNNASSLEFYTGSENQTLSVETIGKDVKYQWYFNGKAIDGATEAVLKLDTSTTLSAGEYYCIVSSLAGELKSNVATVVVHQAPEGSIIKPLSDVYTIAETGYAYFEVETSAHLPSYSWYYGSDAEGWQNIYGVAESKIKILATSEYANKQIKCVISSDGCERKASTIATLNCTSDAIVVNTPPSNVICKRGETATFNVVATTSTGKATYQWQYSKNGDEWTNVENATSSTYSVAMSDYTKCGYYRCEIDNGGGIWHSPKAELAPTLTITEQPQDTYVFNGKTATFTTVLADSSDVVSYKWQRLIDGNWIDIAGANSQTYSFTMSEDLNGSQYRCKYELPSNTKCFSETATCYFAEDVKIIKLPENIEEAELYSTVKFTIEVSGYNPQYEWSVSADFGETWNVIANSNSNELSVYVSDEDIILNSYRCRVWNDNSEYIFKEGEEVYIENTIEPKSPYNKWANDAGLIGDNALPSATPHNDGITNLEKFTFGLDASKATSYDANANFKHSTDASGNASLQFPVSVDAEGVVNVKALKSVDLINWNKVTDKVFVETSQDGKFKIYKVTAPVGEEGKVFLKLKVEEN